MLVNDISYLLEVLAIRDGETEDELDEKLKDEAKELGVDIEDQKTQRQDSFQPFLSEHPRRSESIESRASQSTGLTSSFSDVSKDQAQYHSHRRPSRISTSLSFRDYDVFISRGRPEGRHSLSFSPVSTPAHSTFSLPLSQPASPNISPKRHFRKIRGLSMLKSRQGSANSLNEECPHCPQDSSHHRRAIHKLPCGHKLCTQALRNTVRMAIDSKTGAIPSCCGRPIPGRLVEHAMTQEEQYALLDKLEQWDEAISLAPSVNSSRRDSVPSPPVPILAAPSARRPALLSTHSRGASEECRISTLAPQQRKDIEWMMEREDYILLRTGQSNQRDRFLQWVERARQDVEKRQHTLRETARMQHEFAVDELMVHHSSALAEAEDKQVKAESDMRAAQEQEKRDNATALKHMEAHCAGQYSNGEPHGRLVTDQALAELDKARRFRDAMNAKHDSQINVLRGEQSRRIRLRAQRQERELQDLKRQQRKEELELERLCTRDSQQLEESIAGKKRKIRWRWELQMAIFTKKVETETGVQLEARLPTAEWTKKGRDCLQVSAHAVSDSDRKQGISHSFAMRGLPSHQQHFSMGG